MAEYKLTYFNARGVAEPIRWILAYSGQNYEDIRIEREQWPELKPKTPWGQLPVLTLPDGSQLAQSVTIARYLARKFNLTGTTDLDAARCDELVDALGDLKNEWKKFFLEQDATKKEEAKKNLLETVVPKYLSKLDQRIENNPKKRLVGDDFTWADLMIVTSLSSLETSLETEVTSAYPNLKGLKEEVENIPAIKTWIEKRPVTQN